MAAVSNIPRDLQESIRDVLDKRVKVSIKRLVKMEIRGDKVDNRVLALSACRLFILSAKVPTRLDNSFHFLEIQGIESKKSGQLSLTVNGKDYKFISVEPGSEELDHLIIHLGISLKQIFPSFPLERLIMKVDIQPEDRLKKMQEMIKNMEGKEVGPCGGYTTMYQCMCDYHNFPFRDEVAWDVDTIYLSHDSRELRLQDFDHLHTKDLIPIISALEHNTWFRAINGSNLKLTPEACNEIIKVMRRNAIIEELNLSNTGIKGDFVQKLTTALISNSGSQLQRIDFSNNMLDDKAITHLLGAIKMLPCGVTSLDLSKTAISTKCLNSIGESFSQSPDISSAITSLILSDNGLRGEDFPMLYNFIAQPNSITTLDLSATDCVLDSLCDPLLRGCSSLTSLKLSRTCFSHKRSREPVIPHSWKQLFASACFLESVDLSNCRLPAEALKELLMGIASNRNVKELSLDINSNDLGSAGSAVLASCIPEIRNLKGLDISNNGLDSDLRTLLPELCKNSHLKELSIGRNFSNIKVKYMQEVMTGLVQLIQDDSSTLEYLSIADSKLKTDTSYIINALGSNDSLFDLDISGNAIGDHGARMLAKALLINTKLRRVVWDKNNVTAQGFEDVAEAMKKNMTMKQMPFPVNDASASMRLLPERTETALQKIESYLQRNHCPRRFAPDQAYRLQQGFLISSTQQILDRKIVQVQDTINALNSLGSMDVYADDVTAAENLLKDADKSRQLLPRLQDIALASQSSGNPVDGKLQETKTSLHDTMVDHLKLTLEDMLQCTSTTCPAVMKSESFKGDLREGCQSKVVTRNDFMQGILERAGADIYNHTGEINLAVASLISDNVVDEVIDSLSATYKTLTNHLLLRKSGAYKENTDEADQAPTSRSLIPEKASPIPGDKRLSKINRKTRPQSTIGFDAVNGHPSAKTEDSERLPKISADNEPVPSFDELPAPMPMASLGKSRPRREKVNRPTRPVLEANAADLDHTSGVDNGLQPHYPSSTPSIAVTSSPATAAAASGGSSRKISKEEAKTDGKSSSSKGEENAVSSGKESKKWSPMSFMKKNKEDKSDKEKEPSKKSHSFSLFKKKDNQKRPSVTESPISEASNTSSKEALAKQEVDKALEPTKDDSRKLSSGSVTSGDSKAKTDKTSAPEAATPTPEKLAPKEEKEKPSPVRPPRERQSMAERVALLPPKKEVKVAATLAKEEDVSLVEKNQDVKVEENKEAETRKEEEKKEEKKEESKEEEKPSGPKLPPGAVKMGGLAALGNRNLLDQLKERQGKRASFIPTSPTAEEPKKEETAKPKENPKSNTVAATTTTTTTPAAAATATTTTSSIPETNNNHKSNDTTTTTASAGISEPSPKPTEKPTEKPIENGKRKSAEETTLKVPSPSSVNEGEEEEAKKDPSPSPTQKSSPTPGPKYPSPAPRAARRPLSTSAVDSSSSSSPSASPLTSSGETEQKEGDRDSKGPMAKPRPPPPLKPRPALAPRPAKRLSGIEDSSESTPSPTTMPLPNFDVAAERPHSAPDNAFPATPAVEGDIETKAKIEPAAAPKVEPTPTGNSEIVYSSETLRLSVKDKIKRMSKSAIMKPAGPTAIKAAKEKAVSLPRDSKLPEDKETEDEDNHSDNAPVDAKEEEKEEVPIPKTPTITPASPITADAEEEAVAGDKSSSESQPSEKKEEDATEKETQSKEDEQPPAQDVIMV